MRLQTPYGLSGGRFVAGLGSGSTPKDFEATGINFADRFKLLRDNTAKIKRLLNGETVDNVNIHPWPNVQGRPAIVLAAGISDRWIGALPSSTRAGWRQASAASSSCARARSVIETSAAPAG